MSENFGIGGKIGDPPKPKPRPNKGLSEKQNNWNKFFFELKFNFEAAMQFSDPAKLGSVVFSDSRFGL